MTKIEVTDRELEMVITAVRATLSAWRGSLKLEPKNSMALQQVDNWQRLLEKIEKAF